MMQLDEFFDLGRISGAGAVFLLMLPFMKLSLLPHDE
jgi:hypothetical protein